MDSAEDSSSQLAARWYARLRAPDCTPEEREQFEAWRASDPRNAAAYAAAERMNDALGKLAMADPRLKAMVDQAASAGATLPDDEPDESPGKPRPLTITAGRNAARGVAPHSAAFCVGCEHRGRARVRHRHALARRNGARAR